MAKEKLVAIHVHTPFTLTLGDQSKREFGRGRHNVPEEVASHWFTQAHAELSESVISDTDDLQEELARRAAGESPGTDLVKPLIDTGQYRRAITHIVRDKDADS